MDAKIQFLDLKEQWKKAKGAEREKAEKSINAFFATLSEDEKKEVQSAVSNDFSAMHKEIAEINQTLDLREKLSPILPIVSISYIAKHFFGKSASWFYQRLSGNLVHGKPAQFTEPEIKKIEDAIHRIGHTLIAIRLI